MKKPGVTLKECIESGLPFRRPEKAWIPHADLSRMLFSHQDVLATDWEIKEAPMSYRQHSRINGHFRGANRRGWIAIDFDEKWIGRDVEIVITEIA